MVPDPADLPTAILRGEIDGGYIAPFLLLPPYLPAGAAVGDLVVTAGLQRGGYGLVVAADGPIRGLADLRGQAIAAGVFMRWMLSSPLSQAGVDDPRRDIAWQPPLLVAPDQAAAGFREGRLAAAVVAEPYATAMETAGVGRILMRNNSPPMEDDYCCTLAVTGALVRSDRAKAAAITRAMMRGSAWVRANPEAAAQLQLDVGQVSATLADNLRAIRTVDFSPSVAAARRNTLDMLMDGKRFGYLDPATDEQAVIDRIYVPVTGELPSRLPGTGAQAPSGQRSTTSPWPWLGWGSVGVAALGATLLGRRRATQGGR